MPIPILMPALSPTMEEGKLAKWLVKEGDTVRAGDVIAEIETDKATMEVEAVDEGRVGKILVGEGTEGVKVNNTIAVLLGEGEGDEALANFSGGDKAQAPRTELPKADTAQKPEATPSRTGGTTQAPPQQPSSFETRPTPAPRDEAKTNPRPGENVPAPAAKDYARARGNGSARLAASPLARRLAEQRGLDLNRLVGTGPQGRIIKRDIEQALKGGAQPRAEAPAARGQEVVTRPATAPAVAPMSDEAIFALYQKGSYEIVPHDNMRRIIAKRLTEAKSTIPHFYLTSDCELDALLAARARINAMSPKEGPHAFKLSVNDLVIKAMAMALQKVPAANATWTEQGILRHKSSDIGIAVAVQNGLFTPVVRNAELKSLSEISNEMKDLATRARARRLAPHEYQGGTTAISNLGMYGVKSFDAVINPPHATILAVGVGEKRPVVKGDTLQIATVMSCTLSCDHRVVDGALGAELLAAFKGFIEEPVTMLV